MTLTEHLEKENPKRIPESVRLAVLHRDSYQCQLCGTSGENRLQLHHLILRSQGGKHVEENLVTLCFKCHQDVHEGRQDIMLIEVEGVICAFPNAPQQGKTR